MAWSGAIMSACGCLNPVMTGRVFAPTRYGIDVAIPEKGLNPVMTGRVFAPVSRLVSALSAYAGLNPVMTGRVFAPVPWVRRGS